MSDHERITEGVCDEIGVGEVLRSPGTSFWLRDAIRTAMSRDPLDALSDAEMLLDLLQRRLSIVERDALRLLRGG